MITSCFPPYSLFFPKLRSPSIPSLFLLALLILHCTTPCSSMLGEFAEMNQEGKVCCWILYCCILDLGRRRFGDYGYGGKMELAVA
ncbi:hypothetical protein P8452_17191 [Trifolium repens]|nr:hypothetical protein P8452_17191 [Trifolium repens]